MKKRKFKAFHYFEPVYRDNFLFFVGSEEDLHKYINKNYDFNLSGMFGNNTDGKCFAVGGFGYVIYFPEFSLTPKGISTLIHEINHAGIYVFEGTQTNITDETSEPFCYYTESLVRKFLELYLKK